MSSATKGRRLSWRTAFLGLVLVAWPGRAPADDVGAEHFSSRGRVVLGGHVTGGWQNNVRVDYRTTTRWWIDVAPSAMYFVRDRVGVGGWLGAGTDRIRDGATARSLDLGVEALFDLKLGPRVGLFVVPGVGFGQRWVTDMPLLNEAGFLFYSARTVQSMFVRTQARLPLVFYCSSSIAIGFGPQLTVDVVVRDHEWLDGISSATYDVPRTQVAVGLTSFVGGSF